MHVNIQAVIVIWLLIVGDAMATLPLSADPTAMEQNDRKSISTNQQTPSCCVTNFAMHWSFTGKATDEDMSTLDTATPRHVSATTENRNDQETLQLEIIFFDVEWYIMVVCNPIIAILGLFGNILSAILISKSGLDRPSNIFLLALAVADSFSLLSAVDAGTLVTYTSTTTPRGILIWDLPEKEAYLCFIFHVCSTILGFTIGPKASSSLCLIIAVERFIAVYFPLNFATIVTTRRAWVAAIVATVIWTPYAFYYLALIEYDYIRIPETGFAFGGVRFKPPEAYTLIALYVNTPLGNYLPVAVVALGSILISVKLSIMRRKRQKLVKRDTRESSAKTTRTLLAVCLVFTITRLFNVYRYIAADLYTYDDQKYRLISILTLFITYVNGSSNFLIYVAFNPKFRSLLVEMFQPRSKLAR